MISLLLHALAAFGIVVAWYLLLFAGIEVMFYVQAESEIMLGTLTISPLAFLIPFALAFGALYLPPQGRLYALIVASLITVALWVYIGIHLFAKPAP